MSRHSRFKRIHAQPKLTSYYKLQQDRTLFVKMFTRSNSHGLVELTANWTSTHTLTYQNTDGFFLSVPTCSNIQDIRVPFNICPHNQFLPSGTSKQPDNHKQVGSFMISIRARFAIKHMFRHNRTQSTRSTDWTIEKPWSGQLLTTKQMKKPTLEWISLCYAYIATLLC
jgi:hypothetical protein